MIKKIFLGLCALGVVSIGIYQMDHYRKKSLFVHEVQRGPKKWMEDQIGQDLSLWKEKGVTSSNIALTLKHPDPNIQKRLAHIKVADGKVTWENKNCACNKKLICFACGYVEKLQKISDVKCIPDMEFIIYFADGVEVWKDSWKSQEELYAQSAPIFAFAKRGDVGNERVILFPDYASFLDDRYLSSAYKWKKMITTTQKLNKKIPWEKKIHKAFWRGSASRGSYSKGNWKETARSKLTLMASEHHDVVDAKFTRMKHLDHEVISEMQELALIGDFIPVREQGYYKYHINMDGWKCTYPGFQWRLLSNSLVLKEDTQDKQWFYGAIKPFEHYVPFESSCEDLLEKIKWASTHDAEAKQIAEQATQFVENNLLPHHIDAYAYFLLIEYSKTWKK